MTTDGYARHGIPGHRGDDLPGRLLRARRAPGAGGYGPAVTRGRDAAIHLPCAPNAGGDDHG